MRVIAGKARSIPLKTVEGQDTRPTTDRIKETLFNMLQNELFTVGAINKIRRIDVPDLTFLHCDGF